MNALASLQTTLEYQLEIIEGPEKGTLFKLTSNRITIGRGPENHIALTEDPHCSRNHAVLNITENNISIENISDKNNILVNGLPTQASELSANSTIKVGGTQFRLKVSEASPQTQNLQVFSQNAEMAVASQGANALSMPDPNLNNYTPPPFPPSSGPIQGGDSQKKKKIIRISLVVVLLLGALLLLPDNEKEDPFSKMKTEAEIERVIETNSELQKSILENRRKKGKNDPKYQVANRNFIHGMRDYKQGQFERATETFQACLSLYPSHQLCSRYYKLSQKKFAEQIQHQMVLGRKFKDKHQWTSCKAAFRNVMFMVKDRSSKVYREARSAYRTCRAKLEDRF